MKFPRASGILLHPTSLPGPYGIGEIGPEAERFADFLQATGQQPHSQHKPNAHCPLPSIGEAPTIGNNRAGVECAWAHARARRRGGA